MSNRTWKASVENNHLVATDAQGRRYVSRLPVSGNPDGRAKILQAMLNTGLNPLKSSIFAEEESLKV